MSSVVVRGSGSAAAVRLKSAGSAHKSAHTDVQHARFTETDAPPHTAALQDPFSVYLHKLSQLERAHASASSSLSPHHLVIDCVRILEDVLVQAGQTFLLHRPPPSLLALTVEYAQTGVAERLRDAEVISPESNRQIEDSRKLARWVLVSSAREVPNETAQNCLQFVTRMTQQMLAHVQAAAEAKPHSGCSAKHAFCRDMSPAHLDVVGGPHNAHTIPPNTRPHDGPLSPSNGAAGSAAAANGLASPPNGAAASASSAPPQGGLANPNGRSLKPAPRAHAALPYGWDVATFEAHCAPLHNTTHLDLAAIEAEEEAAEAEELATKEAERAEKVRLRDEAAERRRARREAEEKARRHAAGLDGDELSDLDENPDEVDSEDERLTARRRSAREAAGEGAPTAAAADDNEEEEGEDDDEDEEDDDDDDGSKRLARLALREEKAARKAQEASDELVALESIPARVTPAKTRFLFTFCCIGCHSVLLRGRDIDRVRENQVWSKAGKNLASAGRSLVKNFADAWLTRPADEREKKAGGAADEDEEEEEEPPQEEEDESQADLDAPPRDEGASKREESVGVHCAGCNLYVGRFFPVRDAYRLIYIQRSSGQNFMYHTGDASVLRLRPLLQRRSEEEEEAEAERLAAEEEQGSDEDDQVFSQRRAAQEAARAQVPVQPVVGVPFEYVDEKQAAAFPYPRFGPCAPYHQPSNWQLFHAQITDAQQAAQMVRERLPKGVEAEESKENGVSSPLSLGGTGKFGASGPLSAAARASSKPSTKLNSKTYRPPIPPVPTVHTMLRRTPDSHYALPPAGADAAQSQCVTADLSVLLWTDRVFHNRRALDLVTARVLKLFFNFPAPGTPYANTTHPPVPLFAHFFLAQGADFTMCRGTARYVFHMLTQKDDSKVKRIQYTYKKFVRSLSRWENSVSHLSAGGYGGHRFVLVKVGSAFRIFQSNHSLEMPKDRFTCTQWIKSDYPWSRILDRGELMSFLAKFEEARRGRRDRWEELFTAGRPAQGLFDRADEWQPEQVFFAQAKLQDFTMQM